MFFLGCFKRLSHFVVLHPVFIVLSIPSPIKALTLSPFTLQPVKTTPTPKRWDISLQLPFSKSAPFFLPVEWHPSWQRWWKCKSCLKSSPWTEWQLTLKNYARGLNISLASFVKKQNGKRSVKPFESYRANKNINTNIQTGKNSSGRLTGSSNNNFQYFVIAVPNCPFSARTITVPACDMEFPPMAIGFSQFPQIFPPLHKWTGYKKSRFWPDFDRDSIARVDSTLSTKDNSCQTIRD